MEETDENQQNIENQENQENLENIEINKPINTLILPACGQNSLYVLGALKVLREAEYWHHENIEEIFATSSGTLLGMFVLLNIDFELIKQYFVCRPWQNLIPGKRDFMYNLFGSGVLKRDMFSKVFEPLFKMCDMEIDITMGELYKRTNIKFNIFVTNLDEFALEKISHESHPNIPVLDAIYMSACIPVLFEPITYKNKYYIDGAIFNGNPQDEVPECNKENTLSFNLRCTSYYEYTNNPNCENNTEDSSVISPYWIFKKLVGGVISYLKNKTEIITRNNEVKLNWIRNETIYDYKSWINFFYNKEDRLIKINLGEAYGHLFLTRRLLNREIQEIMK